MSPKIIYIDWEGPYTFDEVDEFDDDACDYGLYQVYGRHPLYGDHVLLFLGATDGRTFADKLAEEADDWEMESGLDRLAVYFGHLSGVKTPEEQVWQQEIDQALRFLIYVHKPVFNCPSLGAEPKPEFRELHIINQGERGDLETEVSSVRYLLSIDSLDDFDKYGKHGQD